MGPRDTLYKSHSGQHSSSSLSSNRNSDEEFITVLGFGSLLSETSSRLTFPDLKNFRLGRVANYRRVFAHPASIFFQRGIANLDTLEMSSLSVEKDHGNPGFIVSAFDVPKKDMMQNGIPSRDFLVREEEFSIVVAPFTEIGTDGTENAISNEGVICTRSTDTAYIERWGIDHFNRQFRQFGVDTIWNWPENSGLRPCPVYMRHCYLAAKRMGNLCFNSFLDETYLVDRKTTIRDYIQQHPNVLEVAPPPELASRYSG